ncbi:MAG: N-6 DNA methylase, partial [Candidatus Marinimicrobia bacterium]|nr:N-6 DNA methylase [Candidatus Neomarinimicrobiota bacterium]
ESGRKKRGTAEVDDAFLSEIESWRDMLARNIALRNSQLENRVLNDVVQKTIDRILFLRICEDRGVENYGQLMALLNGVNIYSRMSKLFLRADERYNSGLFHFSSEKYRQNPDEISLQLAIDDKSLKEIIKRLYYPESPYEFSVLPADILGQVYERFLGKVIRLTPGHRAVVEDKPEVRKAGGVYYTPTYIVDYIVKNTVGKLLEGKTPKQAENLKILDPACGSGSFLLGAYQYLMDWHLEKYTADNPEKYLKSRSPKIYQIRSGDWRLSTAEKKRILLNNIYGVDIDTQAVEVTKLSLLLKVLEGETDETLTSQLKLFHERALPDLGNNIKCGNSLIGSDFYEGQQLSILAEDEMYRINAFDWDKEFQEIFHRKDEYDTEKGFDAVIGNPPYGAELTENMSNYLKAVFTTQVWRGESYLLFVEKSFRLLKVSGLFGYIIPDTYLNLGFTHTLRSFLFKNSLLKEIVLLPSNVFQKTSVDTTLLFAQKTSLVNEYNKSTVRVKIFDKKTSITTIADPQREFAIDTDFWYEQDSFNVQSDTNETRLIKNVESDKPIIKNIAEMFYGIKVYQVGKGKPPQTKKICEMKPFTSEYQLDSSFLPFYDGKHVGRYALLWKQNNWLKYGQWIAEPRKPEKYENEKILIRKIVGKTLIATYVPETSYCNTLLFVLKIKDDRFSYRYLLGILNSRLIGWYFRKKFQVCDSDTFPQIMIRDILQIPIPLSDAQNNDRMVTLVEQMLDLNKRLIVVQGQHEKTLLQRQIEATDRQIDKLVYELYGLTEEEIGIVEGTNNRK